MVQTVLRSKAGQIKSHRRNAAAADNVTRSGRPRAVPIDDVAV